MYVCVRMHVCMYLFDWMYVCVCMCSQDTLLEVCYKPAPSTEAGSKKRRLIARDANDADEDGGIVV